MTYRPPVPYGPADHAPCVAPGTNFQWENLGRVQPWNGQPRRSEDGGEEEDEEYSPATHARGVAAACFGVDRSAGQTAGAEHADALTDGAPVECPATTDSIEGEDANQSREHVCDVIETRYPETVSRRNTGDGEDGGAVDGDTSDADPLLENLEPDDELDAAPGVQLAGLPAQEHGQVAVLARSLALELDDVADILELGFGGSVPFTAETAEDEPSFFLAPDFDEPARGFRHRPYDDEEEDEGHDLESNGEAPDEGGVFVGIEGGSIFDPVRDDDAENVESEFDGDELTAGRVAGGFGGPDGGNGVEDAGSDAVQDTGAKHPVGVLGGALEGGADYSPYGGYGDGLDTTVSIAEPASEKGAEEGTGEIVNGDLKSQMADK